MPFSRPGGNDVIKGGPNGQRFEDMDIIKQLIPGKIFDNEFNAIYQNENNLEQQIKDVAVGAFPGSSDIENNGKAYITDGQGNVGPSFIGPDNLAERAVQERHHGDASVSNRVLQNGIVTGDKAADRTFPTRVYMDESVTGDKVAKKTIDYSHLRPGAGRGDFFAPKGIPTEAYGDRSIPTRAIALGAIGRDELSAEVLAGGLLGPEIGSIILWPSGTYTPPNYFDGDGRPLLRSEYAPLFARYGTTYGGSGLYFNLPDLRGRFLPGIAPGTTQPGGPLGSRITAATASDRNLGGTGGAETHSLTSAQNASHNHTYDKAVENLGGFFNAVGPNPGGTDFLVGAADRNSYSLPSSTRSTGSSGSGAPHNNMPPFLFIRYLIKVK